MDRDDDRLRYNPFTDPVRNVEIMARRFELEQMSEAAWAGSPLPDHVELRPPDDWRHPVTGRRQLDPSPELVQFGKQLRRSRRLVSFSQERLGRDARVTQSMISRAERGLAPAMGVDRLARVGRVLGRAFPLGFCPHEHDCAWQPIVPREYRRSQVEHLVDALLGAHSVPVIPDD